MGGLEKMNVFVFLFVVRIFCIMKLIGILACFQSYVTSYQKNDLICQQLFCYECQRNTVQDQVSTCTYNIENELKILCNSQTQVWSFNHKYLITIERLIAAFLIPVSVKILKIILHLGFVWAGEQTIYKSNTIFL